MNKIQVFQHEQFGKIRVVELNGESWFVGKDIAQALGYENTRDAFRQRVALSDKDAVTIPDGIGRCLNDNHPQRVRSVLPHPGF